MVKSMTGYGRDTFHLDGTVVTVEIKSVNSRYLDFIPKFPRSLQDFELTIKKIIQKNFYRGRIEVYISLTGEVLENKKLFVDWGLLDQYMSQLADVQARYELKEAIPLSVITSREELFTIQEDKTMHDSFHPLLCASVQKACEKVLENRNSEGVFLIEDILNRLEAIYERLHYLTTIQDHIYYLYRERMKERIERLFEKKDEMDEGYIIREVALLAEKGDIQEELTRLFSHVEHFRKVVKEQHEIGRKLDFIAQEMHREANTIGAKSIDAQVSEEIVAMKSDIEKIKEQVQNIE